MAKFRASLRNPYGYISVEGETPEEVLKNIDELLELSKRIKARLRRLDIEVAEDRDALALKTVLPRRPPKRTEAEAKRRRGKSEAVVALESIERRLLQSGFFKQPRSTSEVRQRLKKLTGIGFQSRKVSQALGILYKDRQLSRTGPKGSYRYYERP